MAWVIEFSDDAWAEFFALDLSRWQQLESVLFGEWLENGPHSDLVQFMGGVLMREEPFDSGVTVRFTVVSGNPRQILVLQIKQMHS